MPLIIMGLLAAGLIWWGLKTYGDDEALIKKLRQGGGDLGFCGRLIAQRPDRHGRGTGRIRLLALIRQRFRIVSFASERRDARWG